MCSLIKALFLNKTKSLWSVYLSVQVCAFERNSVTVLISTMTSYSRLTECYDSTGVWDVWGNKSELSSDCLSVCYEGQGSKTALKRSTAQMLTLHNHLCPSACDQLQVFLPSAASRKIRKQINLENPHATNEPGMWSQMSRGAILFPFEGVMDTVWSLQCFQHEAQRCSMKMDIITGLFGLMLS